MTVVQLMEITGKSRNTVLRRIKERLPGKDILNGSAVDLNEMETYLVLKSFQPGFEIREPFQDGKEPFQSGKAAPIPNGAQLRELRLMVERHILSAAQIQSLMGIDLRGGADAASASTHALALPMPQLSGDEQTALRIALNIVAKRARDREAEKHQGHLFGSGEKN